jgi:hypothetical protein
MLELDSSKESGPDQERTGHCGNAAIASRLFFENVRLFFKNAWHFKDIFREFEAFLK